MPVQPQVFVTTSGGKVVGAFSTSNVKLFVADAVELAAEYAKDGGDATKVLTSVTCQKVEQDFFDALMSAEAAVAGFIASALSWVRHKAGDKAASKTLAVAALSASAAANTAKPAAS